MAAPIEITILTTTAVADETIIAIAPSGIGVGYAGTATIEQARDAVIHWESPPRCRYMLVRLRASPRIRPAPASKRISNR